MKIVSEKDLEELWFEDLRDISDPVDCERSGHSWERWVIPGFAYDEYYRQCKYCGRQQKGTFKPSEMIWEDIEVKERDHG